MIYYYENTGSFLSHSFTYRGAIQSIDVGNHATPYLGDVNGDGVADLLIGNEAGTAAYYEKTGTSKPLHTQRQPMAGIDMVQPPHLGATVLPHSSTGRTPLIH